MSALFSPISLRSVSLPNRIVIAPMCQYSANEGQATDWHLMHLGQLAMSGAALLCLEATAVESDGRISPFDLGLWNDATEAALVPVLALIRKYSTIAVCVQLAHAGRKASSMRPWEGGEILLPADGGWLSHAPSAIAQRDGEPAPIALDHAGLDKVRDAFVQSAIRAARLGFDAIELHGAHGYLLHQFLSPLSNHRTDEYGGSLDNRFRFPLEVFDAVRAAFPSDKPVGMKLSATDWIDGGWNLEQTIAFAQVLTARGVDWIDVSTGGISRAQKIPVGPGYQVPFAEAVRSATGAKTIAVGLITHALQAEEIIASGQADFVALARGILFDPRWPWHAAAELNATVSAPAQYWRSEPQNLKGLFGATVLGQR
ncbi:MAG: NADH:flavin oxidoreductase/NADH oxidase [Gemmatimonadota bacterium]|nr:NADH:flavin oxidoreductase/NADH oxidase [Gemmatimonadota bacterium]